MPKRAASVVGEIAAARMAPGSCRTAGKYERADAAVRHAPKKGNTSVALMVAQELTFGGCHQV
jgi:hypothetical protein